jgi:transposase-like protein
MNRLRRTIEQWRELVAQQQVSGLSVDSFCKREGLASSTFFAWRRKVEMPDLPPFVELTHATTSTDQPRETTTSLDLLLPCGVIVRVREGVNIALLRQIVEALQP